MKKKHIALNFSRKQGDRVAYLDEKNSIKFQTFAFNTCSLRGISEFNSVDNKIQFSMFSRRFFRFDIPRDHFKLIKQDDVVKGNLELETTRQMENSKNFIRCYEICRVWDVSLSHYPTQPNETLYFAKRATTMSPQSLIELICGLTRRQES